MNTMNTTTRNRTAAANELVRLLKKRESYLIENYGLPIVRVDDECYGVKRVAIVWDGPFEWAPALTGGSHLCAGETGSYSTASGWHHEVSEIERRRGLHFECENSYSLTIWDN